MGAGHWANPANGPYVPECMFQFKQNGVPVISTPQRYGNSVGGNKSVCYAQGQDQSNLPCNVQTVGWAWVGVHQYSHDGPFVYGPTGITLIGDGGFGFNVPC